MWRHGDERVAEDDDVRPRTAGCQNLEHLVDGRPLLDPARLMGRGEEQPRIVDEQEVIAARRRNQSDLVANRASPSLAVGSGPAPVAVEPKNRGAVQVRQDVGQRGQSVAEDAGDVRPVGECLSRSRMERLVRLDRDDFLEVLRGPVALSARIRPRLDPVAH